MSDCQMANILGKAAAVEETNEIQILDTDCEDGETLTCNQGFQEQN